MNKSMFHGESLYVNTHMRVRAQSCLTLSDHMNCSPPGSSVHGIFQARIVEWVAISYSRVSSWPKERTPVFCVSCIGKRILYHWCRHTYRYIKRESHLGVRGKRETYFLSRTFKMVYPFTKLINPWKILPAHAESLFSRVLYHFNPAQTYF